MILLVDRKKAIMFTYVDGVIENRRELHDGHVPQRVKEINKAWMRQDKIFRHIEDHLHQHLKVVGDAALSFAKENHISFLFIGTHKPLYSKVEKYLPHFLLKKVKGKFVTELKGPFNEILKKVKQKINTYEERKLYG